MNIKIGNLVLPLAAAAVCTTMILGGCKTEQSQRDTSPKTAKPSNSASTNSPKTNAPTRTVTRTEDRVEQDPMERYRSNNEPEVKESAEPEETNTTVAMKNETKDTTLEVVETVIEPVVVKAEPAVLSVDARFKDYQPRVQLAGRMRSVGSDTMDILMKDLWEKQFRSYHPDLVIFHEGEGSGTAIPALINNEAEFGPMSRAPKESEIKAFFSKYGYSPVTMPVAVDAMAIYVHPSNPIRTQGMTLQQLDSIYSSSRLRGGDDVTTWGQLGITSWADNKITVFSRNKVSGTYGVFKKLVLKKGDYKTDNREMNGSRQVVQGVENDPYAIGYSGIGYKTNGVAMVPIAAEDGSPVMPSPEAALSGAYPLARSLYISVNVEEGTALSPLQEEFIRFIYSKQGQELVIEAGFYPVTYDQALKQFDRLGIQESGSSSTTAAKALQIDPALPDYKPTRKLAGRMRSAGSDTMDNLMEDLWEKQFRGYHPDLVVFHQGEGSGTAIPALINGASEIGPMSRKAKDSEIKAFYSKFNYEPTQIVVAVDALAIYVHPDNPVIQTGLSLPQLDAIYSDSFKKGLSDINTWKQVGVTGTLADQPIKVYSRNKISGTYGVFKKIAMAGGNYKSSNLEMNGSSQVVAGVENNVNAIGYSGIGYKTPKVAVVPIAKEQGGQAYMPTPENAFNGNYPIARNLYITINHKPGTKLTPLQEEFVRFIFSKEGQAAVIKDGFFPVSADEARKQLKALGLEPGF